MRWVEVVNDHPCLSRLNLISKVFGIFVEVSAQTVLEREVKLASPVVVDCEHRILCRERSGKDQVLQEHIRLVQQGRPLLRHLHCGLRSVFDLVEFEDVFLDHFPALVLLRIVLSQHKIAAFRAGKLDFPEPDFRLFKTWMLL